MLESIAGFLYDGVQMLVAVGICILMVVRYDLVIDIAIYSGLAVAVGLGFMIVAVPVLVISPFLVPVAFLLVVVAPLWLVFK
jgi:hypothetical protein